MEIGSSKLLGSREASRMGVVLDLSRRRVLVAGASSGAGRAVADLAARAGARVALAARRVDRLEELAREVRGRGGEAHPVACDVADEAACRECVARAAQSLGGLDALVYAPGLSPLSLLVEADADAWLE